MHVPKILYAASNRIGARAQLTRCLSHLEHYTIKTAGYQNMGLYLDWTLDALSDMFDPKIVSLQNDNFEILFDQIKSFNPDLIISDLEPFTSYAGQLLNKPVWQVSPLLLYQINFTEHPFIGIGKYKSNHFTNGYGDHLIDNIIINADKNLIYSHLVDIEGPPKLPEGFNWVRPYYYLGETSVPCQHQIVAAATTNKIIRALRSRQNKEIAKDAVIFSANTATISKYPFQWKSIDNTSEYACNLKNCQYFLTDGCTDTLADAFYNEKYSIIVPELFDKESVINMLFANYYHYGYIAYNETLPVKTKKINIIRNEQVSFLHQEIDRFFEQ